MTTVFLPKWSAVQNLGGWAPVYKLTQNQENWSFVRKNRKPLIFPSYSEALKAAESYMVAALNSGIRHEKIDVQVDEADVLGIEDWRNGKREDLAQTQIFRNKRSMKPVTVERKGQGRKHHGKAQK